VSFALYHAIKACLKARFLTLISATTDLIGGINIC
jgi:hypothetical protein